MLPRKVICSARARDSLTVQRAHLSTLPRHCPPVPAAPPFFALSSHARNAAFDPQSSEDAAHDRRDRRLSRARDAHPPCTHAPPTATSAAQPHPPQMNRKRKGRSAESDGSGGMDLSGGDGSSSKGAPAGLATMSDEQLDALRDAFEQEAVRRMATSGASSICSQAHRAPPCACA